MTGFDQIFVSPVPSLRSLTTKGIAMPAREAREIELIKRRLAEAERDYRERQK
jgi:hypothetical protein